MDFRVFESALGSYGVISYTFWTLYLKNKHIPYKLHYYFLSMFLFDFYISCLDQTGIRERRTELARVLDSRT